MNIHSENQIGKTYLDKEVCKHIPFEVDLRNTYTEIEATLKSVPLFIFIRLTAALLPAVEIPRKFFKFYRSAVITHLGQNNALANKILLLIAP